MVVLCMLLLCVADCCFIQSVYPAFLVCLVLQNKNLLRHLNRCWVDDDGNVLTINNLSH